MGSSGDRLETDLTCCFGTVPCISPTDCLTFAETRDPVLALCQFLQRWTMNQRTDSQDQRNCSSSQRSKEARCLAQFVKKELRIGTATSGSRSRLKVQGPPEPLVHVSGFKARTLHALFKGHSKRKQLTKGGRARSFLLLSRFEFQPIG